MSETTIARSPIATLGMHHLVAAELLFAVVWGRFVMRRPFFRLAGTADDGVHE